MQKKIGLVLTTFLVIGILLYTVVNRSGKNEVLQIANNVQESIIEEDMKFASSVFNDQGMIPSKYTCDGENISPGLVIKDVPQGTQSLALIVDDPDALSSDWAHWLVWNIEVGTYEIDEGQVPQNSVQGLNDFGNNGYGGPCPPSGTHRYQFKLYALDVKLDLNESSKKEELIKAIDGHVLGQVFLTGLYQRK